MSCRCQSGIRSALGSRRAPSDRRTAPAPRTLREVAPSSVATPGNEPQRLAHRCRLHPAIIVEGRMADDDLAFRQLHAAGAARVDPLLEMRRVAKILEDYVDG